MDDIRDLNAEWLSVLNQQLDAEEAQKSEPRPRNLTGVRYEALTSYQPQKVTVTLLLPAGVHRKYAGLARHHGYGGGAACLFIADVLCRLAGEPLFLSLDQWAVDREPGRERMHLRGEVPRLPARNAPLTAYPVDDVRTKQGLRERAAARKQRRKAGAQIGRAHV